MKTVGKPTVFSIFKRLFIRFSSHWRTQYADGFAKDGFYIKIRLALGLTTCVEQNPHQINYKVIVKSKFNFFKVENRRQTDDFLNFYAAFGLHKIRLSIGLTTCVEQKPHEINSAIGKFSAGNNKVEVGVAIGFGVTISYSW